MPPEAFGSTTFSRTDAILDHAYRTIQVSSDERRQVGYQLHRLAVALNDLGKALDGREALI